MQNGHPASEAPSCTLAKGIYTCNLAPFKRVLAAAQTVSVETQPMDRFTGAQLRHLVHDLGKTAAAPDQPANLNFILVPVEGHAIRIGAGDVPLATLRVYAAGPESPHGNLVWAESFSGQPDRPWPATVDALIQQFRAHLATPAGS